MISPYCHKIILSVLFGDICRDFDAFSQMVLAKSIYFEILEGF